MVLPRLHEDEVLFDNVVHSCEKLWIHRVVLDQELQSWPRNPELYPGRAAQTMCCSKNDGDGIALVGVSMVGSVPRKRSREAAGIGHDEEEAILANGIPPESSLFQLQVATFSMTTL